MQSEWEREVTVVVGVEVPMVEVLMVVCLHCRQICHWSVWWCGGVGEEVQWT